jgi:16S rRNA (uracil1498-N3)-methyltransferase
MPLPYFYKKDLIASAAEVVLDETTSKHIVQVLRMQNGEQLQLTNGIGYLFTAEISDNNRKRCAVSIIQESKIANQKNKITIAISPIKSNNRFEWFLEKATEIGVSEIVPLICNRTEKNSFKFERINSILISAMLQSQQCWLPVLTEPIKFENFVKRQFDNCTKYIAHCLYDESKLALHDQINKATNQIILIGPEGDFTAEEIELALQNDFNAVALGNTRLRTETAGIVAATLLSNF